MLETKKPRRTKEQIKAVWHRKAQERTNDVICVRCGTITNKIHHHCVSHKYGKGYSVSVCTRCHGEINALVWNPEKHLLRPPYWGKTRQQPELSERTDEPNLFELIVADNRPTENQYQSDDYDFNETDNLVVEVISVTHRNTGKTYFMRGCSYSDMARITGFTRNMIIDSYVGAFPLLIINGKEYAAGFGPLAEYWIRDLKGITDTSRIFVTEDECPDGLSEIEDIS